MPLAPATDLQPRSRKSRLARRRSPLRARRTAYRPSVAVALRQVFKGHKPGAKQSETWALWDTVVAAYPDLAD